MPARYKSVGVAHPRIHAGTELEQRREASLDGKGQLTRSLLCPCGFNSVTRTSKMLRDARMAAMRKLQCGIRSMIRWPLWAVCT